MTDLGDFDDFAREEDDVDGGAEGAGVGGTDGAATADAGASASGSTTGDGRTVDGDAGAGAFDDIEVETPGGDYGVGVLSAANGLSVGEDEDDTRLRAYVTVGNRSAVRVGTYLLVPYPDGETLFSRISGLSYAQEFHADDATEIHARRAMRSSGIDEQDYKFLADLEPVAILYSEGDELKRRMTDRVPKPETVVRRARDAGEIKTGLKIPGDGVFVGHLSVGGQKVRTAAEPPTIDYRIKDDYGAGDPLVFRHTLIAGGTGSGKTHAAKNVLRQYLHEERSYPVESGASREVRPSVVLFDPQDEYAQMHDDNPEATDEDARAWERQGIAHGGHDDTVVFVPKVGEATYSASHHRAEQVEFTLPFSMVRGNPWLVAGSGLNDNQYGALVNELIPRFFRQYGDAGTYEEFLTFLDDPTQKQELDEAGRVHEATYDALKRRVQGFSDVFDGDARPIDEQVHEFVRPGGLTVVPTYHVNDSRAASVIVLALSSLLVDQKLSNDPFHPRIKETPLIVGMDEAHNFLADADTVQAGKVIGKFTEAAKQGRKERLGLFLITQDPQDVAGSIFKQINTTICLNLGDEDAISAVNIPSDLEGKVPYMETGQMVVYSPDNSEPVELVGLPTCVTRHGRE